MRIFSLQSSIAKAARLDSSERSAVAQQRLLVLERFDRLRQKYQLSGQEAAEVLGVARSTLYRWRQRRERHGPRGLEPGSRRPRRLRGPSWSPELVARIETLRAHFPAWHKGILAPILRREGWQTSESTVGRILSHLIRRGRIQPALAYRRRHRRSRMMRRLHAQRLFKPLPKPTKPGQRLQLDTLHLRPLPDKKLWHFTAHCPVSRWTAAEVYSTATSVVAARFLDHVLESFPFPIDELQVDGGSEFMADFERTCQQRNITLYVLPPRSPKLNGSVERMNETWRAEFYEVYDLPTRLDELRPLVRRFQNLYNTYRPHRSLSRLTPAEYLQRHHQGLATLLSHMY